MGVGDGAGFTLNIPWSDNTITAADYMQAALHVVCAGVVASTTLQTHATGLEGQLGV